MTSFDKLDLLERVEQLEDEVIRLQNSISRDRSEILRLDKIVEQLIQNGYVSGDSNERTHA